MNYFNEVFLKLEDICWLHREDYCDTITLYSNGDAILFNERCGSGSTLAGEATIENIFVLPDAIIEILTTIGKVTCSRDGKVLTEQKIKL